MTEAKSPLAVLILCTGNSARSILGEALLNRLGNGRVRGYSAGSHPKGVPNPLAIELLTSKGYDTTGLRSKSWSEFTGPGAPVMDIIITVCDEASGESCPYWPGHPLVVHWGIPDPAGVEGTLEERRAAFALAYERLHRRVTAFLELPLDGLPPNELKARLNAIGALEGATEKALREASA